MTNSQEFLQKYYSDPDIIHKKREQKRISKARRRVKLLSRFGSRCNCCGNTEWWNLTIDHIKPVKRKTDKDNFDNQWKKIAILDDLSDYQCLCYGCNNSKSRGEKCKIDHGFLRSFDAYNNKVSQHG